MASSRPVESRSRPLLVLASVVLILYFAREIFVPLALAVTLSFVLKPLVTHLQRLKLGRVPASVLAILVTVAVAGGIGWGVGMQLVQVANDLPQYRDNIREKIAALHAPTGGAIGKATQAVKEIGKEIADTAAPVPATGAGAEKNRATRRGGLPAVAGQPTPVQIVEKPESELQYLQDLLKPALKPLGLTGVVLVFTLFVLIKREDLRNRILRLAGLGQLNVMTQALDDGAQRISRYLMLQLLVNASYGVAFGFGLFLIGIPNAMLWGAIAGVLRLVPYVGALTGAALPFVLALAVFNTWMQPVLVVVLYMALEGVVGNLLEPWLYGAHTGISSLAILVSAVFWTMLWGWAGLILSTPLTVCVIVLGQYVPHLSFLHVLLGDEEALSADAQFYQRLLSLDSNEARTIAESYLKTHALTDLYDSVFVPALALAEQDRHKGALDETRETFIFLSTSELVAELADHKPEAAEEEAAAIPESPKAAGSLRDPALTRVITVPAHDQADEITASMLAQLIEQAGYGGLTFPVDAPWEEALKALSLGADDVVCIAALPPFAFTHAKRVCQRVRGLAPESKIVVAIWGFPGDVERARARFGASRPDGFVTTMAAALARIGEWHEGEVGVNEEEGSSTVKVG